MTDNPTTLKEFASMVSAMMESEQECKSALNGSKEADIVRIHDIHIRNKNLVKRACEEIDKNAPVLRAMVCHRIDETGVITQFEEYALPGIHLCKDLGYAVYEDCEEWQHCNCGFKLIYKRREC